MTVLGLATAAVLLWQSLVLLQNVRYRRLRAREDRPTDASLRTADAPLRISVLIPARNEVHNLPRLIACLNAQKLPAAEIIVCDDASEDGTTEWLAANAPDAGFAWFQAEAKPVGWMGKCWACDQLGARAAGEWLLFLDADMEPGPEFLLRLSANLAVTDAQMVTAGPCITPTGVGDGTLIAIIPFVVLSMLPLNLAERSPNPAHCFANGQAIAFRREDYLRLRPHEQVRAEVLEDVNLARFVKGGGETVRIVDAVDCLQAHMYDSTSAAIAGFAKNSVAICRSVPRAVAVALIMPALYLLPLAWAAWTADPLGLVLVGWTALLFGATSRMAGLPRWYGLLYPLAFVLAEVTLLRSIVWNLKGNVMWKGRAYPTR